MQFQLTADVKMRFKRSARRRFLKVSEIFVDFSRISLDFRLFSKDSNLFFHDSIFVVTKVESPLFTSLNSVRKIPHSHRPLASH